MVRVDVFKVKKSNGGHQYYLVPIYVSDTVKERLPNRAVMAHKEYDEWKIVDDKDFVFSLYSNDLLFIGGKEIKLNGTGGDTLHQGIMVQNVYLYYRGLNIAAGTISVEDHDSKYIQESLGVGRVPVLEKYEVSVLGDLIKAPYRPRETFKHKAQRSK